MDYILALLKQISHGLAEQFGKSCEIVIHDLKHGLDTSIVHIENGQVTNRQSGDGPSSIVLEALTRDLSDAQDKLSYLTRTEDGRILKSSTMYIRAEDGSVSYIFSINYDITSLLSAETTLRSILSTPEDSQIPPSGENGTPQTITHNVGELLDTLIDQALSLVGKPVALMNKDDKVKVVRYLNDAGAFLITKSGDKISKLLNISKFTLYSYMDTDK